MNYWQLVCAPVAESLQSEQFTISLRFHPILQGFEDVRVFDVGGFV